MASLEKVRFLVVDDNLHMLNIIQSIVRGFGAAHVFVATNIKEALAHLRSDFIDIVILDYELGDESGVDLTRTLRSDPASPAPHVPVIMLTSHSERSRVEAARDAGVTEFCAKPVVAAALLRRIVEVIDRPRAFVRAGAYFGPDRRRRRDPDHGCGERRAGAGAGTEFVEIDAPEMEARGAPKA